MEDEKTKFIFDVIEIERDRLTEMLLYTFCLLLVPMIVIMLLWLIGSFTSGTNDTSQWSEGSRWLAVVFGSILTGIGYGIVFGSLATNDQMAEALAENRKKFAQASIQLQRIISEKNTLQLEFENYLNNSRRIDRIDP